MQWFPPPAATPVQIGLVFLASLAVGTFLDRCIRRLDFEKSVFWPFREYCRRCFQPVPWFTMIPIVGNLLCLYRCRACKARLPLRGALVELVTAGLITGLFVLYVGYQGIHVPGVNDYNLDVGPFRTQPERLGPLFVYHSVLICLLVVATFVDLDVMLVPDLITVPGMLIGLVAGSIHPEMHPLDFWRVGNINTLFSADVWQSQWAHWFGAEAAMPGWLESTRMHVNQHWTGGNDVRWFAFFSGFVGLVVGGGLVWVVRAVFSLALQREAMGFGDVTLMAMVGSFIGWQSAVIVFLVFAPISGLFFGLLTFIIRRRVEFAFVPHLALGTIVLLFFWQPIWRFAYHAGFQLIYYYLGYSLMAFAAMTGMVFLLGVGLRWVKEGFRSVSGAKG